MTGPDLGFVEPGQDPPDDTATDRPFLNAIQRYTHIVRDGATAVTRGGVVCALDGGTVQMGMYDVTDGAVGAPRVFRQSVTLPERPLSGAEGYELDSYVFELEPVELAEYVGRELAVAVRHDSPRNWGKNWNDEFRVEQGWGISEGERDAPLGESWQTELWDRGGAKSGALFVDSVETPAGTARTVLGAPLFADRSQTVLTAFPDLTPAQGMLVQYDTQTDAGATVTVLENGVVEVGQGSTATDRFAVSVRDTDGTWYGPETITLTEPDG
jgi:hypothetical protein